MQDYISLDPYINSKLLEDCHLEICYGLAKSEFNLAARPIPHFEVANDTKNLIAIKSMEGPRVAEIFDEHRELLNRDELSYYRNLSHEQKKRFLLFYKDSYCDGEYVRIRFPKREFYSDSQAIFQESKCEWHANSKHFPKTVDFIKSLPFEQVGRILFFVTYHHLPSDVHYDRENDCYDGRNHYLWFNPFNAKKFFLLDENGNKVYVPSKCAIFNGRKLHGNDPAKAYTYTLRIDGQLSEKFCKTVGILWQSRNSSTESLF